MSHAYDLKRLAADGFDDNGEIVVPNCVVAALRPLIGQIDGLDDRAPSVAAILARNVHLNVRPCRTPSSL